MTVQFNYVTDVVTNIIKQIKVNLFKMLIQIVKDESDNAA